MRTSGSGSSKTIAAIVLLPLALGFLGKSLLSEEAPPPPPRKAEDMQSARRHSARWHAHIFRDAGQGREFDQFLGGEFKYKEADGKSIVVAGVPGKVVKLAIDSVTLQPNDGGAPKDFAVKADPEDARDVSAQLRHIEIGGRAVVITVNGEARWVIEIGGREPSDGPKAEKKDREPRPRGKKAEKAEKKTE